MTTIKRDQRSAILAALKAAQDDIVSLPHVTGYGLAWDDQTEGTEASFVIELYVDERPSILLSELPRNLAIELPNHERVNLRTNLVDGRNIKLSSTWIDKTKTGLSFREPTRG